MPPAKRKPPAKELAHITPDLRPLAVNVQDLTLDPRNARLHGDRSLDAIGKSLEQFGQRKPIVANRQTGQVIAGNGTLQAMLARGWKWIACVMVDDDPTTATGYAIADNRTAELSEWDNAQLQALLDELQAAGVTAVDVGFTDDELQAMIDEATGGGSATPAHEEREADESSALAEKWQVLVTCDDEADQLALLHELQAAGRTCRALNS